MTSALFTLVAASTLPIISGTKQSPMFCTQKINEYALPRYLEGIIFGTLGHREAGTSEKETPNMTIAANAIILLSVAGTKNAKVKWHTIISMEPSISIVAPFPL